MSAVERTLRCSGGDTLGAARQIDDDRGAVAGFAHDMDRAAVMLDERFRDRKAEAGPLDLPRRAERREDVRHDLRRDSDSGIRDLDAQAATTALLDGNPQYAAIRGEFDRVREQVEEDLGQ